MDSSLLLSEASFLFSHDAATGYYPNLFNPKKPWKQAISTYMKNQIGTAYDQLNNGARALDLRPKVLLNGTIIFRHGVDIPVTLDTLVEDVVRWCNENVDELVLLLPSNVQYEYSSYNDGGSLYVSAMKSVFEKFGVNYVHCNDVYGLTVSEAMELSRLPSGGSLLALDQQNYYGGFCGKMNWVPNKIVTCYSYPLNDGSRATTNVRCTEHRHSEPLASLKDYVLSSANNEATDSSSDLGPPANLYDHPFNEIQAFWQVDTHAVTMGVAHTSTLLEDHRHSGLNAELVQWIYDEEFAKISLLAVDNVALHGNALLSVLRNTCGQSTEDVCGREIPSPRLIYVPLSTILVLTFWGLSLIIIGRIYWKLYQRHKKEIDDQIETVCNSHLVCT